MIIALIKMERASTRKAGNGHGGRREGAGRKPGRFRLDAPHRRRVAFERWSPVHVTMRCPCWVLELRTDRVYRTVHGVLERYVDRPVFRVVHISIQDNHLHLVVEAANHVALERGMRSLSITAARAVHAAFGTRGQVFHRYHSTVIRSRRYARNVIAYVLCNWRHHRRDVERGELLAALLDRYSSAISFDGWSVRFEVPTDYRPLPVSPPRTRLLRIDWEREGRLDPNHAPGPPW